MRTPELQNVGLKLLLFLMLHYSTVYNLSKSYNVSGSYRHRAVSEVCVGLLVYYAALLLSELPYYLLPQAVYLAVSEGSCQQVQVRAQPGHNLPELLIHQVMNKHCLQLKILSESVIACLKFLVSTNELTDICKAGISQKQLPVTFPAAPG